MWGGGCVGEMGQCGEEGVWVKWEGVGRRGCG